MRPIEKINTLNVDFDQTFENKGSRKYITNRQFFHPDCITKAGPDFGQVVRSNFFAIIYTVKNAMKIEKKVKGVVDKILEAVAKFHGHFRTKEGG